MIAHESNRERSTRIEVFAAVRRAVSERLGWKSERWF